MWRPLGEPWRAWGALGVGILAVSAHSASSVVLSVLMKAMVADLGWTRSDFATAATARMLAMTAMLPVAGQLADRVGARAVLTAGALVVGVSVAATAMVRSLGELVMVSVVMGPGQACIGAVAASALVLRLFKRRHGIAVGLLNGGDNVLNAFVPPAAASLLAAGGWRSTLLALAGAYLVLGGLTFGTLGRQDGRAEPTRAGAPPARLADLPWGDLRLWGAAACYALVYAWVTSLQLHLHAYLTDAGRPADLAARLLGAYLLIGAAGAPLFGWIAERTSARAALATATAGLTLSAAALWNVSSVDGLYAWALFHGLVNSGAVALLALVLAELFGRERIGRLLGVVMVACMGATMLGNLATAGVFDRSGSYVPAWQAYTALMLVGAGIALWLWRAGRRR